MNRCVKLSFCLLTALILASQFITRDVVTALAASQGTTPPPAAPAKIDFSKGFPEKAPGASHLDLPKLKLGDPATSSEWGLDEEWGISLLDHQSHTEKYKIDCTVCHHTNTKGKAMSEDVQRCVVCHKREGDAKNPKQKGTGTELYIREAFHVASAGCIQCHEQAVAKNADSVAPTTCSGCHEKK